MNDLLAELDAANAQRESAPRIRAGKRADLVRGVPGLPKAEDYVLSWLPPPSEEAVRKAVEENPSRRGLIADPGGHEFQTAQYLKPKVLNAWQQSRACQPARSYKRYLGKDKGDLREFYRSHSQPCEFKVSNVMGEQHRAWLKKHFVEREKHLYPVYFYRKGLEEDKKKEEARLMKSDASKGLMSDALVGAGKPSDASQEPEPPSTSQGHTASKMSKTRTAPQLDHDIELDPPRFDYVPRVGRMIALSHPWQLADEMRKSKKLR